MMIYWFGFGLLNIGLILGSFFLRKDHQELKVSDLSMMLLAFIFGPIATAVLILLFLSDRENVVIYRKSNKENRHDDF